VAVSGPFQLGVTSSQRFCVAVSPFR